MQALLIYQTAGQTAQLQLSSLGTSEAGGGEIKREKNARKEIQLQQNAVLMDHGISDTQQEDDLFSSTDITKQQNTNADKPTST